MEIIVEGSTVYNGDCLEVMDKIDKCSVDSVVTDPPYHLTSIVKRFGKEGSAPAQFGTDGAFARASKGFMGKEWDGGDIAFQANTWRKCYELLKPGGHLIAFSGSRTYHRMAVAIEDAGFEIRDQCIWLYGSGFPKSHNIGNGWGTALKPAHEPMVLARKPLSEKSVAENVNKFCTGAINIDACRIEGEVKHPDTMPDFRDQGEQSKAAIGVDKLSFGQTSNAKRKQLSDSDLLDNQKGRWPSNVMHDGSEQIQEIFPETTSTEVSRQRTHKGIWTAGELAEDEQFMPAYGDQGNASRYFYCAKTSKDERKSGLGGEIKANTHPTVKPVELMRYLVRLVTPKGGLVLDPFMGSGSTGMGAREEDFRFVGIEKEEEYYEIAKARIKNVKPQLKLFDI